MDTLIIWGLAALLILLFVGPYVRRMRRQEARNRQKRENTEAAGLNEPPSLHPHIDPEICLGSGACVKACPEGDILGLIEGRAALIHASRCVGHGECAAACPVGAITLVFGTAKRGVDIPHVKGDFETNIPGLYIAGELGGMGLIRNAIRQGRQAVEGIAAQLPTLPPASADYDLLIIGAGPAGIAASLTALQQKLRFRTIEQESPGGAARHYPRQKIVMTEPMELPLYGKFQHRQIAKEELIDLWDKVMARTGLQIHTGERALDVQCQDGLFKIATTQGEYSARRVVLAIGRRGTPRKLGVPGEAHAKVAYQLLEPEHFSHSHILVVGGGNSALEAAWALACQGRDNQVTLVHRGQAFDRARPENRERLQVLVEAGKLAIRFETVVREIREKEVLLNTAGQEQSLPNDQVFIFAGGELPTDFLQKLGVSIERKFGEA